MNRSHAFLAIFAISALAAVIVVPAVADDVPDARLVVSDVSVEPEEPTPESTTTVEFTVENSVGSATGVRIERVVLRDRTDDGTDRTVHAEAEEVGSLSVGDGVTLELSPVFESAGTEDLELHVEAVDEDGEAVTVSRPVAIVVGGVDAAGITDDVQIDASTVHPSELDDEEALDIDLGVAGVFDDDENEADLRTPLIRIEVTNFGTAAVRDVVVEPSTEGDSLARLAVDDVAPGETESVIFDASEFNEPTTIGFEAAYTLGTDRRASETAIEYRPNVGSVSLTDVDMVSEDGRVSVSGNAANVGLGAVYATSVEIESTPDVEPAYPNRDYFVGTVPESEFVRFDLTATVDDANATTIPVTVSYLADGRQYEHTVELEYEPREEATGESGSNGLLVGAVVGAVALGGGIILGWRRRYGGGD